MLVYWVDHGDPNVRSVLEGWSYGLTLGFETCTCDICFPYELGLLFPGELRYDQLMSFCWTILFTFSYSFYNIITSMRPV